MKLFDRGRTLPARNITANQALCQCIIEDRLMKERDEGDVKDGGLID